MPKTTMGADLLQSLQVLAQFAVHTVRQDLGILAIHNVALTVEEPCWDLVLSGVLDDGNDAFELFGCDFTGSEDQVSSGWTSGSKDGRSSLPLVEVHIGLLADKVRVTTSNTFDFGQGIHDLLLAIDVGIEKTKDELEI